MFRVRSLVGLGVVGATLVVCSCGTESDGGSPPAGSQETNADAGKPAAGRDALGEAIRLEAASGNPAAIASMERTAIMKKMKTLLIATLNYETAHRSFAPFTQKAMGQGSLAPGWRVAILPFLKEMGYYEKFDLKGEWNNTQNTEAAKTKPDMFKVDSAKVGDNRTIFVIPYGPNGVFNAPNEAIGAKQITDGESSTAVMFVVKDEAAVAWNKPNEYDFSQPDFLDKLRTWPSMVEGGPASTIVGFADGSVKRVEATLEGLATLLTATAGD